MTVPSRNRGNGFSIWSYKPDSSLHSNTGIIAPSKPGWTTTAEPWEEHTISAARFMATEDLQIKFVEFHVVDPAGSNDSCSLGIWDIYGDVIYTSGMVPGLLNVQGARFYQPSQAWNITGGVPYYAGFGYGSVGSSPATILTACYPGAPDLEGYGGAPQQWGFQDTACFTNSDGTIVNPSLSSGPISPHANYGEAAMIFLRIM